MNRTKKKKPAIIQIHNEVFKVYEDIHSSRKL